MNTNRRKGFSFIEILVVITIVSVMTAIAAVSYSTIVKGSRNAKRKADLEQLKGALELYRSANGAYPTTSGNWNSSATSPTTYIPNLVPTYIQQLPVDPQGGTTKNVNCAVGATRAYLYKTDVAGLDYKLIASCIDDNTNWATTDQYYDPCRPNDSWQVSSSQRSRGTNGQACDNANNGWYP